VVYFFRNLSVYYTILILAAATVRVHVFCKQFYEVDTIFCVCISEITVTVLFSFLVTCFSQKMHSKNSSWRLQILIVDPF